VSFHVLEAAAAISVRAAARSGPSDLFISVNRRAIHVARHLAAVPATGSPTGEFIGWHLVRRTAGGATKALVTLAEQARSSAAAGYVCAVDDTAKLFALGVTIAPDDAQADQAVSCGWRDQCDPA
jgi:hypothetical protein